MTRSVAARRSASRARTAMWRKYGRTDRSGAPPQCSGGVRRLGAYVDPGNFATNFVAGARCGHLLVWVVVLANLMAMVIQYLAAKLGVATGRDLPELCREHFGRPVALGLWVQAELVAMATDLAEFVGAAIGLNLVFGVPVFAAGLITAVVAFVVLALEQRGYRRFELAIAGLLGLVFLGLCYDLWSVGVSTEAAVHGLLPSFAGPDSLVLAVGIIGATVMPHAIYLHSALTKKRVPAADDEQRHELLRFQRIDVIAGLTCAGLVNLSMILVAANLFHASGRGPLDSIESAHAGLVNVVGRGAALAFAVALLASGLASSGVGTYAGQVVMQGFIRRNVLLWSRRALTMLPALAVLASGLPTTDVLIISQVALSFGVAFALVPLILLSRRRDVLGVWSIALSPRRAPRSSPGSSSPSTSSCCITPQPEPSNCGFVTAPDRQW